MKIEAGKTTYPIPDHSAVELAVLQDGDFTRFLILLHKPDASHAMTATGSPRHCVVTKNEIEFWPVPDKDYTVKVRYLPPAQEI